MDIAKRWFQIHAVDGDDREAVGRPNMRFVPIQSAEQLGVRAVHGIRNRLVGDRVRVRHDNAL